MTLQDAANISTVFGAVAVIGVFIQVLVSAREIRADHERSRREKSVELLAEWAKSLQQDSSLARRIVESLNEEECRKLYNQGAVRVDERYLSSLARILEIKADDLVKENNQVTLNEGQVSKIRWLAVSYLNMLESILVAWQYSVVDREIIEHQFSYLFSPEQGHAALKHLRTAAGGEKTFPAIEIFTNHLEEKRRTILKQKAQVA